MTDYLVFSEFEGKKVVGFHESAPLGSGLYDKTVKEIIIPPFHKRIEVCEVGFCAFRSTEITSVFIPKTVIYLNYACFFDCYSLRTFSFEKDSRLQKIDYSVFGNCEALESIDLPPSLTEIMNESIMPPFRHNYAMTCLSYLGTSTFTGNYVISYYNSSLKVHRLPTKTELFGTIIPIDDGERCSPFPIVVYIDINTNCHFSDQSVYILIHIIYSSLVFTNP